MLASDVVSLGDRRKLKEKNVNKKYIVTLAAEERVDLQRMISAGKAAARKLLHARILLKADASPGGPAWTDGQISEALEVSITTIGRVRQQFVEHSLTAALERRAPCGRRPRRIDGEAEAHLIALACSPVPSGHAHWTIRLLADKLVEVGYVERVGRETVRLVLKKTSSSRGAKSNTVFLLKRMRRSSVKWKRCWISTSVPMIPSIHKCASMRTSKQLVSETRVPIPAEPGHVERYDYEYERQGVCSLFMCFEPLRGRRHVTVSAHRTKQDFARVLRDLVDIHYPDAEKIVLVLDNLNTHDFSALYEMFDPEEAWRIREKIEIHYTPKHGSWLNMAEIELAVLSGQCLDRRIGEEETLRQEIAAWEAERNGQQVRVNWRFTMQEARIKLKRLYPVPEQECACA
jgi:DDE superfamily endonuclease/Homeodomain-like domain